MEPPKAISKDSSAEIFKFEYAKIALFGSMLDSNINYYQKGTTHILLHGFFNVNKTGGMYVDIESCPLTLPARAREPWTLPPISRGTSSISASSVKPNSSQVNPSRIGRPW